MKTAFWIMWLLIIGVSVHDGFLVLDCRNAMADAELNPIGRWLIYWDGGDIRLLLAVKVVGTLTASSLLVWLYWLHHRLGCIACGVVGLLQLLLLIFLYH